VVLKACEYMAERRMFPARIAFSALDEGAGTVLQVCSRVSAGVCLTVERAQLVLPASVSTPCSGFHATPASKYCSNAFATCAWRVWCRYAW